MVRTKIYKYFLQSEPELKPQFLNFLIPETEPKSPQGPLPASDDHIQYNITPIRQSSFEINKRKIIFLLCLYRGRLF